MDFKLFFYDKDGNEKEIEVSEMIFEGECMSSKFKLKLKKIVCPWCEGKEEMKPCLVCHNKNHIGYKEWDADEDGRIDD